MTEIDNSAKRLLEILKRAKDVGLSNAKPAIAWGRVFEIIQIENNTISEADEFEVARRLVQLHQLINDVESRLTAIPELDHGLYLRPFPRIRKVCLLSMLDQGALINVMNQLSEGDLTVLEFCANELSKYHSDRVVDPKTLQELRTQVDSLFDEMAASDTPQMLKEFLLKQLEIIRRAIQEYRIRGIERLQEALERVVGSIILNEDLIDNSHDKEGVSKFK